MLRATENALAGYAQHAHAIGRVAERVRSADSDPIDSTVALIANQHGAEADLAVAKVADDMTASLIHVIA